ncbi:MAG TPA: YceH family protein [Pyrinomonadaceae bacterium]|nr:YceH family protein [Pyrinomonadaceae bacterium]
MSEEGDGRAERPAIASLGIESKLNDVEVRVLGALVEKQLTTPEYYPLTFNALMHACNQISNRDPVVAYDEQTVTGALESLREKKLVRMVSTAEGRVPKYRHVLNEVIELRSAELALLCVLLLRGPQTVGELRGRTERLYSFSDIAYVEAALQALIERADGPLVVKLSRQTGQKESRYAHLLSGPVELVEQAQAQPSDATRTRAGADRLAQLESEVAALRQELTELRQQFTEFKRQFE